MSFSKKLRAASFIEARAAILEDATVPNFVADAVRELGGHAPHLGPNAAAGEIDGAELEITVGGHIDEKSFDVSIRVAIVPVAAAAKKPR